MAVCATCGQDPGDGRFCVRCGHPVMTGGDPVTDTAERPASPDLGRRRQPPPPPPHPGAPPSNARFPMYADEVVERPAGPPPGAQPGVQPGVPAQGGPAQGGPPPYPPYPPQGPVPGLAPQPLPPTAPPARRHGFVPMAIAGVCALLLLVLLALWLVFRPVSRDESTADRSSSAAGSTRPSDTAASDGGAAGEPGDLAGQAQVDVPAVAVPNQDVSGRTVTYDATNMLDGDPQTAWRMPGDGTGAELTIDLGAPTAVTELGLVNGYAKVDRDTAGREVRWYPRNRRILEVSWTFDDGTSLSQTLDQTTRLQSIEVPEVTTSSITLRLVEVSPPLAGPQGRDYTAISDLSLRGTRSP